MAEPQEDFREDSGNDSGTMYCMKNTLNAESKVANRTTCFSPPVNVHIHVPRAGLITRLAANVADTWEIIIKMNEGVA